MNVFSPLAAYIAPSEIMKASWQEGSFQLTSSWFSPYQQKHIYTLYKSLLHRNFGKHFLCLQVWETVVIMDVENEFTKQWGWDEKKSTS